MEKTAVEYLIEQLEFALPDIEWSNYRNETDKAKEMEKKQIIDAFEIGYNNGACVQDGKSIYHGNNYYNQTFKQD